MWSPARDAKHRPMELLAFDGGPMHGTAMGFADGDLDDAGRDLPSLTQWTAGHYVLQPPTDPYMSGIFTAQWSEET